MLPIEDQDILRPGSIFYHYKNLKPYVILGSCKIQEHGYLGRSFTIYRFGNI